MKEKEKEQIKEMKKAKIELEEMATEIEKRMRKRHMNKKRREVRVNGEKLTVTIPNGITADYFMQGTEAMSPVSIALKGSRLAVQDQLLLLCKEMEKRD